MTDAHGSEAVSISSGSSRAMPQISSSASAQRYRPIAPHRRAFSAPDLYAPSSGSASSSSGAQGSSGSSSSSRSSYSHPEGRSLEFNRQRPHVTPLATIHSGERPRRFTSAPTTAITSVPLASPAPPPEPQEEISQIMARRVEELRRALSMRQRRNNGVSVRGLWVATRGLFGYGPEGTAARRESMSLTGKLIFGIAQITVTIAMLRIGALHRSPTNKSLNEWQACTRPLGVWCSIWIIRVFLDCFVAISAYRRKARLLVQASERVNQSGRSNESRSHAQASANDADARPSRNFVNDSRPTRTRGNNPRPTQARPNQQVSGGGFSRLSSFLTFLSFVWFLTAHVLTFTTVDTCRLSSPHLWWLILAIICIGYLAIIEVVVVAFLVFIIWPVIYVLINIILICLGRHPYRNGHINPDIGKLSHKAVDQIPLVLYIPAPKETQSNEKLSWKPSPRGPSMPKLTVPEPAHIHSYPPDTERASAAHPSVPGTPVPLRSRRLFTFRRIRLKKDVLKGEDKGKETQIGSSGKEPGYRYEDKWEKGEYPFVKLEDNRAACAICLCDFDEPKRARYSLDSKPPEDLDQEEKGEKGASSDTAQVETEGGLRLSDAGEGAQPLRLLECAHVFHKTCLDPWLTGVSGRCPVCQRPVEVNVPKKNRTSR